MKNTPRLMLLIALSIVLASSCVQLLIAQERILFLHLRVDGDRVTLLGTDVRPGHLKRNHYMYENAPFQYQVCSREGVVLLEGGMEDPAIRKIEYEDPADDRRLMKKEVPVPNAQFMLRLPFNARFQSVEFFRVQKQSAGAESQASRRASVGRIIVPREESGK